MDMRTGKTPTSMSIAERSGATKVLFFTKKKAISGVDFVYDAMSAAFQYKCLNYEKLLKYFYNAGSDEKPRILFDQTSFYSDYLTPDFVVLDESHCLGQFPDKARKVAALQAVCHLCPILFLSGSPSPESYAQLFHQFACSSFSPFPQKSFYRWADEYVTVHKKYFFNRASNDYSDANKAKIDEATKHLFMSISQKEAGFEQQVEDVVLHVKMKPETYALADWLLKYRVYTGKDKSIVLADTEVKLQQKMHQIYSGTVICEPMPVKMEEYGKPFPKMSKAFDRSKAQFIKDKFAGKKIAILYVFQAELAIIQWVFGTDKITDDPAEFANSEKVFVAQVVASREGVDLSIADAMIMYNIDFSAVSYIQSRQRLNKLGRTDPAKCYWIFSEGGIEDKIYTRVIAKQDYTASYFHEDYTPSLPPFPRLRAELKQFMIDFGIEAYVMGKHTIKRDQL